MKGGREGGGKREGEKWREWKPSKKPWPRWQDFDSHNFGY